MPSGATDSVSDIFTHLFLPLTAVYVLRRRLFPTPHYLLLGGFGIFSDLDKYLGIPGLLHSLVTLVPISALILGVEWWRRDGELTYAPVVVALILSHLVLDFVDGGPVPLLFPLIQDGIGLTYPMQVAFGSGWLGIHFEGPLVALRTSVPRPGFNTYGFIQGAGVASLLLFGTVYIERWRKPDAP